MIFLFSFLKAQNAPPNNGNAGLLYHFMETLMVSSVMEGFKAEVLKVD